MPTLGPQFDETTCRAALTNAGLTAETLTEGRLLLSGSPKNWPWADWCSGIRGGWNGDHVHWETVACLPIRDEKTCGS
jgi:hypothetical protein